MIYKLDMVVRKQTTSGQSAFRSYERESEKKVGTYLMNLVREN